MAPTSATTATTATTISGHATMNAIVYGSDVGGSSPTTTTTTTTVSLVRRKRPVPSRSRPFLVRIAAAGVNPVDAKNVIGDKLPSLRLFGGSEPFDTGFTKWVTKGGIPGFDFSGVVEEIHPSHIDGTGDSGIRVGDRVYGTVPPFVGTFCEFQAVPADQIQTMPSNATFEEAATLPLTGLTVSQALDEFGCDGRSDAGADEDADHNGNRERGETNPTRLLVIGASGGTGHYAVQYAKRYLKCSRVIGICSKRNWEWLNGDEFRIDNNNNGNGGDDRRTCCDALIDYNDPDWKQQIREEVSREGPFTHVFDTVTSGAEVDRKTGYEEFFLSPSDDDGVTPPLLASDGRYFRLGGQLGSWIKAGIKRVLGINLFGRTLFGSNRRHRYSELFWVRFPSSSEELLRLKEGAEEFGVRTRSVRVLPFTPEGVQTAFDELLGRRTVGKIAIRISPEAVTGAPEDNG